MTPQPAPPFDLSVFVVSLSWAGISALMLMLSIREGFGRSAWFWAVSFVASSAVAAVFFWNLV